jgi:pSer/pThr/pTyr-binding forkhead associated (FHA) protein
LPGEEPCYIVLESVSTNTSKVIHVVNLIQTNEIKLGRGHDADVRVTDISVSRLHALLKKTTKGYFVLEDNHSKFGTLALVKTPIALQMNESNFI